jgi:hypothetical protein
MKNPSAKHDLGADSRGAIMVIGIVAGALLVGALWHVAGIGDAIAWRERAQDAVDAGAFENAVWHARGMNVIVAINIVMSLVLMVLVIWRIALILVTVALVIGAVLCVATLGAGCGFTASVARLEARMLEKDKPLAENIMRVLTAMSAAEVAVASATPIVAMAQASANTHAGYDVSSAATQSASLLPALNPKMARKLSECFKGKPYKGKHRKETKGEKAAQAYQDFLANPRLGIGVSLPMQADSYSALCGKAGEAAPNNIAGVMERAGASSGAIAGVDVAKKWLGRIVGSLPGLFCSPMGKGSKPDGLSELVGERAVDSCKSQLEGARVIQGDTKGNNEIKYRDEDGKVVSEDDYVRNCSKKKKKEANDKLKGAFDTKATYGNTDCATPAKVWEWAVNGNVFMRSFAQVEKDRPMAERDDKGLEVADGDQSGNVQALENEEVVAHAEMYFDCGKPRWMDCRSDAPWQLRWRARLRRVQPLDRLLATAIEPGIVATLSQMFNGAGDKAGSKLRDKLGISKIIVPKVKDTWYFRHVTRNVVQRGLYGSSAFDGVGNYIISHSDDGITVH